LAGQLTKGIAFDNNMLMYVVIAFGGGLLGAYYGASRFNQNVLKNVLGIVLFMAAFKLWFV
jgi:uncharacterized membrane protein YfcA